MIRYISNIEPPCLLGGKHRFHVVPGTAGRVRECAHCCATKVVMRKDERMWFSVKPKDREA